MTIRIVVLLLLALLLSQDRGLKADQSEVTRVLQVKALQQELRSGVDDARQIAIKAEVEQLLGSAPVERISNVSLDQGGDNCLDAPDLTGVPLPFVIGGTTIGYTNDYSALGLGPLAPPCWVGYYDETLSCSGPDVVYLFTPPTDGLYRISLCNSDYDTGILVYDFVCPPTNPTDYVCGNDDHCGVSGFQTEIVALSLSASQPIMIVVDGWNGEEGNYLLEIDYATGSPLNDDCSGAQFIEPFSPVTGNTVGASFDDVPDCGTGIEAPGVWFVTIGSGNTMTAHTCFGASYDTRINVYSGDCALPTCVDGNDDACGVQSSVSWCSVAGQPYFILVQGFDGQVGSFTLAVEDDGLPCTPDDDTYTIPEVYANRDLLIGQEITILAHGTTEGLLVHDYQVYSTTEKQPWFSSILISGGVPIDPIDQLGAWIEVRGVIGEVFTGSVFGLDLFIIPSLVLPLSPALPVNLGNWRPASWPASATCDTCKFAVLISGGWQGDDNTRGSTGGSNRADYWDDLADFYCYKRSHEYCEANTKVFYYKGARPTGHTRQADIPAGVVDSCWEAKIKAHFASLATKIAACKRAGQCPQMEVVVSNHGDPNTGGNQGGITMVHSATGADTLYTGKEFRQSMQQLVDSGLCVLDAEFGQCYSGIMVKELADSLDPKSCNVTAAAATDDQNQTISRAGDGGYNYWLNAKCCALQEGRSIDEAVNIANRAYDQVLQNAAAAQGTTAAAKDAIAGDPTRRQRVRTAAAADAAQARADSAKYKSWQGKQSYFRSFCLPKRCQSDTIQVTRGGRIDLKFSGPSKSCGNCEILCQDTLGKWIRQSQWNWNVPGSAGYVNGQNMRRIESGGASNGIYVVHSRSDSFYVKATATNPPLPPSRDTTPSNPEDFAGFAMGWTNGSSAEFGSLVAGVVNLSDADDDGFDLSTAPSHIGLGGVVNTLVVYDVLVDNYWWQNMQVYVQVLNGTLGTEISVQCNDCDNSLVTATLSGGDEEIILPVGNAGGVGTHSFILSSTDYVELDCWGFESANSTGIPPAVTDLTIQRVGDDIQLYWSSVPVAVSYTVQSSADIAGPWTDLGSVVSPGFTHANQVNAVATQLYYQVIAVGP